MLTRRHTLKGRGFQHKPPEAIARDRAQVKAKNLDVLLATRGREGVTMGGGTTGTMIAKEDASQSAAYQAAVRSIGWCMRCGCSLTPRTGVANFCHADVGKGTGIKTDVRNGWNGCASCHDHVGTSRKGLPREKRRALERYLAWKTRTTLRRRNLWPTSLPDTWREADADPIPNPEQQGQP